MNETGEQQEIEVCAVTASTNRNDVIDYTTADVQDETMLDVFSELAVPQKTLIAVRPSSSAQAMVRVTMPEYDGAVLGGLVFTKRPRPDEETGREQDATLARNWFSYVVGMVLRETDTPAAPDVPVSIVGRTGGPFCRSGRCGCGVKCRCRPQWAAARMFCPARWCLWMGTAPSRSFQRRI